MFGIVLVAIGLAVALGGWAWLTEDGNVGGLLTNTEIIGPFVFEVVMWLTQPFGAPGFVHMVPAGIVWPAPLAIVMSWTGNMGASYLAFGQLPPADWPLGVGRVTTRHFLTGTGLGIVPGIVLFVVAGGGMVDALGNTSTGTRRVLIASLVALVVIRRVHLRRRRAAALQ